MKALFNRIGRGWIMNNYELENHHICNPTRFDKASINVFASWMWFADNNFKTIFEILTTTVVALLDWWGCRQGSSRIGRIMRLIWVSSSATAGKDTSDSHLANQLHRNTLRQNCVKVEHTAFPTKQLEAEMLELLNAISKLSRNETSETYQKRLNKFEYELEHDIEDG